MGKKNGFWSTLFAPKKKSSCCCSGQIEVIPEDTPSKCECPTTKECGKEIIVLGTGCSSCKALFGTVQDVVAKLGIDAIVKKEENLENIMSYNVMTLPALVVNGKVVAKGQNLTVEQVKELLK